MHGHLAALLVLSARIMSSVVLARLLDISERCPMQPCGQQQAKYTGKMALQSLNGFGDCR